MAFPVDRREASRAGALTAAESPDPSPPRGYDAVYQDFDSAFWRRIRELAYGDDVGQHSWTTEAELREDLARLRLGPGCRLLDLGCGAGGPLVFLMTESGCDGVGLELSEPAVARARERAGQSAVAARFEAFTADLDRPLPETIGDFEAAISIDVVLHLDDRATLFREVAARLRPGGRFLVSDAGVVTGPISSEEVRQRSLPGPIQLVPAGVNERLLAEAGLRLLEVVDRTAGVVRNASGRLSTYRRHRAELEQIWGAAGFDAQIGYLETVISLSTRGALGRIGYLAELA